ncbi:type II toxin-antitoxin system RelE/ParE family toxin [Paenibacillus sp. CF384]|uniref:type II toxin-antitoxin system RelE/ParE family toxin n=1 Tax=Paenibacillus sp. CF384 TaxID=1884382 RepID=UPI0008988278|nr:type II toxin-antitoxin system RelE/ParE family toxin [Paenibacillus sp. CF384]SDX54991.1 Phage-related protein [Paenibacillus sp. CF384]
MYNIIRYRDVHGNCPVGDFVSDLDARTAKGNKSAGILLRKFIYCESLLKEVGTRAGKKFTKQIDGKLWRMRMDDYRIFFFMWENNNIVLLHTFYKDQNQIDEFEIAKAKREMDDWIRRHEQ